MKKTSKKTKGEENHNRNVENEITLRKLIDDLVGRPCDTERIYFDSSINKWIINFLSSEPMTFDVFQDMYEWIIADVRGGE